MRNKMLVNVIVALIVCIHSRGKPLMGLFFYVEKEDISIVVWEPLLAQRVYKSFKQEVMFEMFTLHDNNIAVEN